MQIVSNGDNLHGISKLVFLGKKIKKKKNTFFQKTGFGILCKLSEDNLIETLFCLQNNFIVSSGDNLHDMSKKKKKKRFLGKTRKKKISMCFLLKILPSMLSFKVHTLC